MKKNILILILIISALGCAVSKQITVPLRLSKSKSLYVRSNYGTAKCQVDYFISINYCNNSIEYSKEVLEKCGANTAPSSDDQIIGQLDFGTPDISIALINNFVQIKYQYSVVSYGATSKNYFNYGQEQIQSDDTIYFNLDSAFTGISIESFQKLLSLLEQQGVAYEFITEKNALFVNSVDKLQALQFVLSQKDDRPYILTINPIQYTKRLSENKFQIMIQPIYRKGFSFLGYNVLESYYVDFDLSTKSVLITEKKQVLSEQY